MTDKQIMEEVEKAMELGRKQGRADAIDEFYEKCREEYWYSSNFMNFFKEVREQLKENNNGR